MEQLNSLICKTCGAPLYIHKAVDGVVECEYCGNLWTVPRHETDPAALHYLRMGEHDLDTCKFDDAYVAYSKAAELDEEEPEAYFGMALSEFKVQYIKDEVNKCVQPIYHINSEKTIERKKFSENKYYLMAMEKATSAQKKEYQKRAGEIDYIRSEFLRLKESGLDYDCFICVKVTDENGARTNDYAIADDIYFDLLKRGYKPFFSEREMGSRTGSDYEAYILYALYSAECMLVVCTNEDYLNTPWVKNEYARFAGMIADNHDNKESDSIAIVFKGTPIERLPGRRGKIQGIDINSLNAIDRIRDYVETHSPEGKNRRNEEARLRAEEARKRAESTQKILFEQEALKKQLEEQNRLFEERLRNINAREADTSSSGVATVNTLLIRAKQDLEYGDFDSAKNYYSRVLDASPECGEAWWGLFLVEFKVNSGDKLLKALDWKLADKINVSRNYNNAFRYAGSDFTAPKDFAAILTSPKIWWDRFLLEMEAEEREIVRSISYDSLKKIKNSHNYANAKRYADEEYKAKIQNFEAALDFAPAHLNLFLEDMGAKNENDLLLRIDNETKSRIENNSHYIKANKSAEGELRARLDAFQSKLYSGEVWWKRFLDDMHVKSEREIFDIDDGKALITVLDNEYLVKARMYAKGDLTRRIEEFEKSFRDYNLWLRRFFKQNKANSYGDIYESIDDIKRVDKLLNNEIFLKAVKYADESQKKEADEFTEKLRALKEHYEQGQHYWLKMIQDFGKDTEDDLFKIDEPIENNKNYISAIEHIKLSKDVAAYRHMDGFNERQKKAVAAKKTDIKHERKGKINFIFSVCMVALTAVYILSVVLAWCGVKPFAQFWYIWEAPLTPGMDIAGATIASVVFTSILLITGVVMIAVKSKGIKYPLVTGIILFVFLGSAIGVNLYATSPNSNYIIGENHILKFVKVADGYELKYFHGYKEGAAEVKIPASVNGKPVVSIDSYTFKNEENKLKTLEFADADAATIVISRSTFGFSLNLQKLTIGSSVKEIEDYAFNNTIGLVEITLSASIKKIGAGVFQVGDYYFANGRDCIIYYQGTIEQYEAMEKGDYWRHYATSDNVKWGWNYGSPKAIPVQLVDGTILN